MSATDVEVVRELLEAFNSQDYERSTALLHEEIEMYQATEVPDSDTYIGRDEFLHGFALWLSGFERGFQFVPEELVDCGDFVFARVGMRGIGRGSGVQLEQEIFHIYEVRDQRVSRIRAFFDRDEARQAAGLAAE